MERGKVELVDYMGTDLSIVNAARVSFHKHHETWQGNDASLINYLAKHNHWSPFAHVSLQFRITAPVFVARQLVKHQVGLVWNEVSRRYVDSPPAFFTPKEWRGKPVNAKQGSSGVVSSPAIDMMYKDLLDKASDLYAYMIAEGVAPEQARMVLPLSMFTEWYWSGSLYAFYRVCRERLDYHAQQETRYIAKHIASFCDKQFPVAWAALWSNT